jgi:hypothetical protein
MVRLLEARVDELTRRVRELEEAFGRLSDAERKRPEAEPRAAYLTVHEAAEYTRLSKSLLDRWRCDLPGGPPWISVRGRILYAVLDLDDFLTSRRRRTLT